MFPGPKLYSQTCCCFSFVKDLCIRGCGDRQARHASLAQRVPQPPQPPRLNHPNYSAVDPSVDYFAEGSTKQWPRSACEDNRVWLTHHRIASATRASASMLREGRNNCMRMQARQPVWHTCSCKGTRTIARFLSGCPQLYLSQRRGSARRQTGHAAPRTSSFMAAWRQQQLGSLQGDALRPAGPPDRRGTHAPTLTQLRRPTLPSASTRFGAGERASSCGSSFQLPWQPCGGGETA